MVRRSSRIKELREFVCFRFGLRELGDFNLRQREQGVSRPELKKFGCSRLCDRLRAWCLQGRMELGSSKLRQREFGGSRLGSRELDSFRL